MKTKKLVAGVLVGAMLIAVPIFARGGAHGKGYMGGTNSNFLKSNGGQLNGYGDGRQPKPMDGTGFGAKRNNFKVQGNGKRLRDGSCINNATTQ